MAKQANRAARRSRAKGLGRRRTASGSRAERLGRTAVILLALGLVAASSSAERLLDPTRPAVATKAASSAPAPRKLHLTSVRISGSERIAIIDGRAVRAGDEVSGARVLSIGLDAVELRRRGDVIRLTLIGDGIEKRSSAEGSER